MIRINQKIKASGKLIRNNLSTRAKVSQLKLSEKDRKIGTYLAYAYLFFYYVRPQEYIPGLNRIPVSGTIFLLFTIWGIVHFRFLHLKTPVVLILLLGVIMFFSSIGAVNVNAIRISFQFGVQLFPQALAIYILFDTKERVLKLVTCWTIIYFFMSLITMMNGGLGPGDFTYDPNDAALALSIGIPWVFFSIRRMDISKRVRYLYYMLLVILILAVIITSSRGGFLGLIAVIGGLWWFSRKRIKVAVITLMSVAVLGGWIISIIPEHYLSEVQSINDPNDGTRVERLNTWEIAWVMYKDNPVLGVGAANFPWYVSKYQPLTSWWTGEQRSLAGRVTHSVYFQVLSELGTVGVLLYFYVIMVLPAKLNKLRNKLSNADEDERLVRYLSQTLIVSMMGYAIAGAFISVAYYPHIPHWIAMYAIVLRLAKSIQSDR
ncbi:MAG: hypothetical protein GY705_30005 [Bacteroidetes bacterium]|nr:hypothetical protein [Bacteroidota bacterium]